ncbi:MAG: hypothetical protein GY845_35480 [Planctomycetes bacterium]|nr:hypothetical protein [Planctomycetota bacterium]
MRVSVVIAIFVRLLLGKLREVRIWDREDIEEDLPSNPEENMDTKTFVTVAEYSAISAIIQGIE